MVVERDLPVPMRDGAVLRADVYRPRTSARVPVIVSRTPYGRDRRLVPAAAIDPERAVDAGFALVCQDVRGLNGSEGDFYPFESEAKDGHDTVEWAAGQPWSSGAVGMAGRSYTAATQWLAATERPRHLAAIFPVVTGTDFYHGWIYQGGAFQLGFNLFWVRLMQSPKKIGRLDRHFRHLPLPAAPLLEEGGGRFYRDWLAHPTNDPYWRDLAIRGRHDRIQVPAYNVGGWFDIFLGGTLGNFVEMRRGAGSEEARRGTRLLIGPWSHGSAYGAYPDHHFEQFGPESQAIDLTDVQLDFFGRHLRGESRAADDEPPVRIFVMGRNAWRDEDDWPLARARSERWFLRAANDAGGGRLAPEPPGDEPPDAYDYDPADPAPTVGGPTSLPTTLMRVNSGPLDQRPVEERPDVLVYTSDPLERPLEVTGRLSVTLYAATSGRDTDWVAKLCDVTPDGDSRILAEGILRARYRDGFDREALLEPGRPYRYDIDLVATSNVFAPGHRIRVAITSSSFPRFDRNPNTGNPLGQDGPDDLRPARQTVFHDAERPSHVVLPVVAG